MTPTTARCSTSRLTDYYGWTVPKGSTLIAGLAVPRGDDPLARFDAFVDDLRRDGTIRGPEIGRAAAAVLRPDRPGHVALGRGSVALTGEAAGLISPSSAEGISYALRSGAALAEALEPGLDGGVERYRDAALPLAIEVVGKMVKSRVIHGPAARRAIMASGFSALRTDRVEGLTGAVAELLAP